LSQFVRRIMTARGRRGMSVSGGSDGRGAGEAPITAVPSLVADDKADDELYAFAVQQEGGVRPQRRTFKFFHGTSWEKAQNIKREGTFKVSVDGCLGPGIYVGREDKARRFAREKRRHGGEAGGLLCVIIRVENPKFVIGNDRTWQEEGYDACRTEYTTFSDNMEWCIKSPEQVAAILSVEKIPLSDEDDAPPGLVEEFPVALTEDALRRHARVVAQEVERRQFNCAQHGTFWKKVVSRKPVARCKECGPAAVRLDAIPKHEERGRGVCVCARVRACVRVPVCIAACVRACVRVPVPRRSDTHIHGARAAERAERCKVEIS